jgi:hypothetical protein
MGKQLPIYFPLLPEGIGKLTEKKTKHQFFVFLLSYDTASGYGPS